MIRQIRWRVAIAYTLLTAMMVVILITIISRPTCIGDVDCVRRSIMWLAALQTLFIFALAYLLLNHATSSLRHLIYSARQIAGGKTTARVVPETSDEVGELVRVYNRMTDALNGRIEQLEAENQQFSAGLENMADGVIITDENGFLTLINPAAARLLQTTETRAIGRSFAEVVRHHELIGLWQRCRQRRREQVAAVEVGHMLFLQVFVTPFREQDALVYLVILQDLTQVRHLQTVRRDFISNISHELRTPLASLRAVVETLQDGALEDPSVAYHFLDRADQEIDTLTQMVEELLELSRIESGQVPLRLTSTTVGELIRLPIERLRPQFERREITLKIDMPENLPNILADIERMQRVVTNLLHNAIKFTSEGGCVTVRAYKAKDSGNNAPQVVMIISDTGIGIAAPDLDRIFERFYKSDRARTRSLGGTGLGLAIARHLVQAHNGRIWVKSKEGKGSAFYFSIPVSP